MKNVRFIPLVAVLLSIALSAFASGQNNSFGDVVRATRLKRVVVDGNTDSTGRYDEIGHSFGAQESLTNVSHCAGFLVSPNMISGGGDNGMPFVRRRANPSSLIGPVVSGDLGSPGYPVGQKQYGVTVPAIGLDGPLTTTVGVGGVGSAGTTTIPVTDRSSLASPAGTYTAYVQIGTEILSYSTGGTGAGNITMARGQLGTVATTHSAGAAIRRLMLWEGPTSAILQVATLTQAISASGTEDILVDSTAGFLAAGALRTPTGEVITYTGITSTSFTGIARSVFGVGVTQTHAIGQRVVQTYFAVNAAAMMSPYHALGTNTGYKNVQFYKTLFATSLAQATLRGEIYHQAGYDNSLAIAGTYGEGTAGNTTGVALGTLGKVIQTLAQPASNRSTAPNQQLTINFGTTRGTNFTQGLNGGCAVMFVGAFGSDRPVGIIQTPWSGRGGFTLNTFHRTMNFWDDANDVCELRVSTIEKYKVFRACGDADVGGNGPAALAHFSVFGNNETGGQGYTGLYVPGYAWTENPAASQATIAGNYDTDDDTIDVSDPGASLRSTSGTLYITDGSGYEYITYETVTSLGSGVYRLNNCFRGAFGTTPIEPQLGDAVRQGYLQVNPKGFASDILFDYLFRRDCWLAAGGSISDFYYIYVRPVPLSASPTYQDHDLAANSTESLREGRLREYTAAIELYCGSLPGFIVLDLAEVFGGDEAVTNDYGAGSGDNIHHTRSAYRVFWGRIVAHFAYGQGAGSSPVPGVDGVIRRGGLRGRPRVGVRRRRSGGKRATFAVRRSAFANA